MNTGGSKLNRKKEQVIAYLLSEPTHAAAAAKAGISEGTLQRWLRETDFQREYREARRQIVEGAVARLQQCCTQAVVTLHRNLTCGKASVEVRAALGILEMSVRAVELADFVQRFEELEQRVNKSER